MMIVTIISGQIFEKYPNIKFHENSSRKGGGPICSGRTDMTKLTVVVRDFYTAPNEGTQTKEHKQIQALKKTQRHYRA